MENNIIHANSVSEVSAALKTIRYFIGRKYYKTLREMCMIRAVSMKEYRPLRGGFGKGKLTFTPTLADFMKAMDIVKQFIEGDNDVCKIGPLNSKGYHADTILSVLDVLLKHNDKVSLYEVASMVDENDANKKAASIRKALLQNREKIIGLRDMKE